MSDQSLLSYVEQGRGLIEGAAFDQAIALGRNLLTYHPKYWAAYRLLGEATLEKDDFDTAEDLFKRVLSIDPEDLLSRVGLATVHDRRGSLDQAIWHMERAYEVAPSNGELRRELQRLYLQRDGAARPRLKLTSGGVARLYARAGRWVQAAQEYRSLLEQNPALVDLQVALAEALWNAERQAECVEVCQDILSRFPDCLKANLILGEIWLRAGKEDEARALLQKAQLLDPENLVAARVLKDRSPLPLRVVRLPLFGEEVPAAVEEVAALEDLPSWLRTHALVQAEPARPAAEAERQAAAGPPIVPSEAPPETEPIPDWLRRLQQPEPAEQARLAEEEEEAIGAEEDSSIPDWLQRLRRKKQDEVAIIDRNLASVEEPAAAAAGRAAEVAPLVERKPAEAELPDWLERLKQEQEAAERPERPEVTAAPEALEPERAPSGVAAVVIQDQAAAGLPAEEPVAGVEIPAVREVAEEPVVEPASEAVAREVPSEPIAVTEPPAVVAVEPAAERAPSEARALETRETAAPQEAEAPDWLAELRQLEPTAEAPAAPPVSVEAPPPAAPEVSVERARALRDSGEVEASLSVYSALIERGEALEPVEWDLSGGVEGHLRTPRALTLLGDLYVKQGQLQKALQAYRAAMSQLK